MFSRKTLGNNEEILEKNHGWENTWWLLGDSPNDNWMGFLPKILARKRPGGY
jgi:hypothetical protein